jgi:5-(carboxyamino)imidazole ribonucleotide mutase
VDANKGGNAPPTVGIIMGSDSDWKTMCPAAQVLSELGVPHETRVVSAHRTPDDLFKYAEEAEKRGLSLIIAGAGGAAHLPGMTASKTILPVVGVPVATATPLNGLDALLSIMQMPAEVGVATVGVGPKGAEHAALFAAAVLGRQDRWLHSRFRARLRAERGAMPGVSAPEAPNKAVILAKDVLDLQALQHAEKYLSMLGVPYEKVIVSRAAVAGGLTQKVSVLEADGAAVFIAGSGSGIGFACEVAKATTLPVLGVPIVTGAVGSIDEFLRSFLDMPSGLATFAIGKPGAINAALFAATVISGRGTDVWEGLRKLRKEQEARVRAMKVPPEGLDRGTR